MVWPRRILWLAGWALVLVSGWLKGAHDADRALVLALLVAGAGILMALHRPGLPEAPDRPRDRSAG